MRLATAMFFAICASALSTSLAQPNKPSARVVQGSSPVDDPRFFQAFYVANACEAAYMPEAQLRALLDRMGVLNHRFIDVKVGFSDTQVLVATLENYSLVCFRGTQEPMDILTNLSFFPKTVPLSNHLPKVDVHNGFYHAWIDVKPRLVQELRTSGVTKFAERDAGLVKNCHPVLIGGHSLGGALAVLAGIDLMLAEYYPVLGVYTFGQPKLFRGEDFIREMKEASEFLHIERFAFKSDLVPTLPPLYSHVGIDRHSDAIAALLAKDKNAEKYLIFGTHAMSNYVRSMAALASEYTTSNLTRALLDWFRDRNRKLAEHLKVDSEAANQILVFASTQGRMREVQEPPKCEVPR